MWKTLVCETCGNQFTAEVYPNSNRRFCSPRCAGIEACRAKGRDGSKGYGKLAAVPCKIIVRHPLGLFPGFEPTVGKIYNAAKHNVQGKGQKIGYVIEVNGHRINVRANECIEIPSEERSAEP